MDLTAGISRSSTCSTRSEEIFVGVGENADGKRPVRASTRLEIVDRGRAIIGKAPLNAQNFIQFIEKNTGIPVRLIGTGRRGKI